MYKPIIIHSGLFSELRYMSNGLTLEMLNGTLGNFQGCCQMTIVVFTLTAVNEFRRFLSQSSTNFHEILHSLFSIHVVTTQKVSRSFDKYLRS